MAAIDFSDDECSDCPCEFCDQLFPFELLMDHQSGCRPDLLHFPIENQKTPKSEERKVEVEQNKVLQKDTTSSSSIKKAPSPEHLSNSEFKKSKLETAVEISSIEVKQNSKEKAARFQSLKNSDDQMQDNESIMVFGAKTKIAENNKLSFKKPSIPLLSDANSKKDNCCQLSDDENDCLEEIWRRADIILKRNAKNDILNR